MSKGRRSPKDSGHQKKSKRTSKESTEQKNNKGIKEYKDKDVDLPIALDGKQVKELQKKSGLNIFNRLRLKRKADSAFLITMLFSNGCTRQFVMATNKEYFTYKKRTYHLRYENSWFDLSFNQYRLFYFDDFAEPVDRSILQQGDKNFFAVTSSNLKPLIKQSYVKALQESGELTRYLKFTMLIAGMTLIGVAVVVFKVLFGVA